jgi:acetoin utilization protein AcuC
MTNNKSELNELPQEWMEKWQEKAPFPLPQSWMDQELLYPPIPRKEEITEKNKQTLDKALYPIRKKNSSKLLNQ